MSRRTLDVVDLVELFVHWEAGRSQEQISESLGLARKTVRKYLAPGGPASGEAVWAQRIAAWFPQGHRRAAAAGDVAGDPGAPGVHLRTARSWGDGVDDQSTVDRRAWVVGVTVLVASLDRRESVGADVAGQGQPAQAAGAAGQRSSDRLRQAGDVHRSGDRDPTHDLSVRDGAGLLPPDVRAAGDPVGSNVLV